MQIGILSLQGAVEPHEKKLKELGAEPVRIKRSAQLEGLSGIILPGGESTTMLHILGLNELKLPLIEFCSRKPTFGVCAGAILLASKVIHPEQESLGLMNIVAERNAYGRQLESFEDSVQVSKEIHADGVAPGVFIRAPKLSALSDEAVPMAWHKGEPVMFRQTHLFCASFHPELSDGLSFHKFFIESCMKSGQ